MADPDSRLTGFRRWLAQRIEPLPDAGEAWCVDCTLNGGRTALLSATGYEDHASRHPSDEEISIRAVFPDHKPEQRTMRRE